MAGLGAATAQWQALSALSFLSASSRSSLRVLERARQRARAATFEPTAAYGGAAERRSLGAYSGYTVGAGARCRRLKRPYLRYFFVRRAPPAASASARCAPASR
eukprot:scaffold18_cov111-Isochrysis_galbana.AAC.3